MQRQEEEVVVEAVREKLKVRLLCWMPLPLHLLFQRPVHGY